jgi:transposase
MLRFGYSKDNRPDLPQLKVGLGVLDPLGMPLATEVVAGDKADDRLYLPAIARMRQSLGRSGVLYVGDSKLGSLGNRKGIAAAGDYYLCPLSQVQLPPVQLLDYLQPYLEQAELQGCEVHELDALTEVTRTKRPAQGYRLRLRGRRVARGSTLQRKAHCQLLSQSCPGSAKAA